MATSIAARVAPLPASATRLPREALHLAKLCEQAAAGDPDARRKAEELDRALMVLSTFDEGPDLVLFYKRLMVLEGNPEYEHHFNPGDRLSPSQDAYIVSQHALFKRWYAAWSKTA